MGFLSPPPEVELIPVIQYNYYNLRNISNYRNAARAWFKKNTAKTVAAGMRLRSIGAFFDTKRAGIQQVFPELKKHRQGWFVYRKTSMSSVERVSVRGVAKKGKIRWGKTKRVRRLFFKVRKNSTPQQHTKKNRIKNRRKF
jgi:hypothetical protein